MATDSKNPYNLRGALLRPSGNQSFNYYLMLIDLDLSSALDGSFVITNPDETGNTLNYHYTGDASKLIAPIEGKPSTTAYFPVYFNQKMDAPDLTEGAQNLFVVLKDSTGKIVLSTGDPYYRHPPIVEVIDNAIKNPALTPYMCSSVTLQSATSNTTKQFVVVMVNSYQFQAINPLIITSASNSTGYTIVASFSSPTSSHPYNGPIAAVGACANSGLNLTAVQCGSVPNAPVTPLNWNPNPPPATIPVVIF